MAAAARSLLTPWALVSALALASACDSSSTSADGRGSEDGATTDAATTDAATTDAAPNDVGGGDAGHPDASAGDATPRPDVGPIEGLGYSYTGAHTCAGSAWAVGVLQKLTVAELSSRTLTADDVVLLDTAPATLPSAGAVLIASAAIPEALAQAAVDRHVPLVAWTAGGELDALVGHELEVVTRGVDWLGPSSCEVHVDDISGLLDADARAELAAARAAPGVARTRTMLLPRPVELCPAAMEGTSVYAVHRNKPHLLLYPKRIWLTDALAESPHDRIVLDHRLGARALRTEGTLATLPGAHFTRDMYALRDAWTADDPAGAHTLALEVPSYEWVGTALQGGVPVAVYDHLAASFTISYPTSFDDPGAFGPTTNELVALWPCALFARIPTRTRTITVPNMGTLVYELTVGGPPGRTYFTAPISRVVQTTLTGLLGTPLVLTADDAQSASADHHNFSDRLILEPARDPSVPQATLDALDAMDVSALYFEIDLALSAPNTASAVWVRGRDGTWRALL